MDVLDTFITRNGDFAGGSFNAELKIMPSMRTIIIGCVDSRVDPCDVFGLEPGEAVVIRNVGGRISHDTMRSIELLGAVTKAAGRQMGAGWTIIVLHHTDCGIISCYNQAPDLLAEHLDTTRADLETLAVKDPYASVLVDIDRLRADQALSGAFMVSGVVYDVADGHVHVVVPPAPLRADNAG